APAFFQRLRLLPHLRRSRRRSRRCRSLARPARSMAIRTRRLLQWRSETSRLRRASRDCPRIRHPEARILRPADRLQARPDRHPFRDFRRRSRLLPLLGEPGRPSCALPLRIPRPRAPAAFRLHLHRSAARQFLAGYNPRLRQGTHLSPARRPSPIQRHRRRHHMQSQHAGLSRADEIRSQPRPRMVSSWTPADRQSRSRTRRRPRSVQPRRPGNPARHRKSELRRARQPPRHLETAQVSLSCPRCNRQTFFGIHQCCFRWNDCSRSRTSPATIWKPKRGEPAVTAGAQPAIAPWTPAAPQLVMAYSVCRGITRTAAKNFYYAFLVLPRRKREALCAVYAFMRRCDDITDDASLSLLERRQKLDTWLAALHRAQQGEPTDDAILLALTDAQRRFSIPAGLLDELALGTAMDIEDAEASAPTNVSGLTVQYRTFEDLRLYCYRVASVVGLVCIHVFGYRDPAAE